ncbi:MAG: UMP kinase [Patescibacteria group bacterium]
MANSKGVKRTIISVGGSLVVPGDDVNTPFLSNLNTFIRSQLAADTKRQFFLVVGGGATARQYAQAGQEVIGHELTYNDMDWLGLHATRLNAHLVRTIFRDIAHPYIIKNYDIIRKATEPVVVAGGWKPGWSTDYCATMLAEDYHVDTVINLSNVSQLFNRDPNTFPDAKPIDKISWEDFRKLIGDKWTPGMHAPFDPIAAKKAQASGTRVVLLSGNDFANIRNYFKGEPFVGTVIE